MVSEDAIAPAPGRTPIPRAVDLDWLRIVPANQATWTDLATLFGSRGDPARCWCQRFRMSPGESWASEGPAELAARLREQTACGHPDAPSTTGLVAYADDEPVGWCAVAPRPEHLARDRGARAIEGYPDLVEGGYVGTPETFRQAGFVAVSQPSKRKVVMRLDL